MCLVHTYKKYSSANLGDACPNCAEIELPCECMKEIVESPGSVWIWLNSFREFVKIGTEIVNDNQKIHLTENEDY